MSDGQLFDYETVLEALAAAIDERNAARRRVELLERQLAYSRDWARILNNRVEIWRRRGSLIISHLNDTKLANPHRIRGIVMGGHDES